MKRLILLAVILFIAPNTFAASFDPSLNWRTAQTDHFNIHYPSALEEERILVARHLEDAYQKLSPKMHWKPWGRTEVIVTDSYDVANGMSSTLPYNWMLLRIVSPGPDSVLGDYDNWLRTLCMHEFSHILNLDQVGGVMWVPRFILGKVVSPNGTETGWLREGIPTYNETDETTRGRGRSSYSDMMMRTAILDKNFLTIDEADGVQWKWPSYQAMYIYGVEFMQYLSDKFGEDKLMDYQKNVARSPLFYAANHQARRTFGDIRFQSKKVHLRYDRERKEGTQRSKSFYTLWKEWKASLEKKYAAVKTKVEAEGLTELKNVAAGGTVLSSPAVSPDGKYLAYARTRVKGPAEIHLVDLGTGVNKVIKKRRAATSIAFSPDSKKIVYSAIGGYKRYNTYSDIYEYDIESKKIKRLTTGERAYDVSYFPDGKKMAFVKQEYGRGCLKIYNVESKEVSDLGFSYETVAKDEFPQFSAPAISPDGKMLAVSSWQITKIDPYPIGQWDIYLGEISSDGLQVKNIRKLTNDIPIDSSPSWSPDGKTIFYASDKSGINNIYRVEATGARRTTGGVRVTNVLTGVYQPAVSPDGGSVYVKYYNGKGFDIRSFSPFGATGSFIDASKPVIEKQRFSILPKVKTLAVREAEEIVAKPESPGKKYSPFGKGLFLPRFIIPNAATIDNGLMFALATGGADPLRRHNWMGGATYRTDLTDYVGYFFNYAYNRFKPVFSAGILGYAVNFGDLTFLHADGTLNTVHLYEDRRRVYGGVSYPWSKQAFGLQYFWEHREPHEYLTPEEKDALNFGSFAGFNVSYVYGEWEKFPASISREHGRKLRTNFSITDKALGSSSKNEQYIFTGDYREYIDMPWLNHVLATKVHGGMVWGDPVVQGTFSLGGAMGDGIMGGGDSLYYFALRGLPIASLSKNRALVFTGEYRMPIVSPQRGLGTLPFYVQNIYIAPFADYGNAWNASQNTGSYFFNNFFLGTGLEVRGDFVIGHGLPVSGRAGYGIVVVNRDRLGSAKGPILNTPASDGVLILELGTAF